MQQLPRPQRRGFLPLKTMEIKIYIAGKITGEPLQPCMDKFAHAENLIRALGAAPVNPFKLGIPHHFTFEESKPYNFKALSFCTAIFMLSDYVKSPGAMEELYEAQRLGLDIFYEDQEGYEALEDAIRINTISAGY